MRVRKNKNKKSSVLASGGVVGSGKNGSIRRRYILIGTGLLLLFVLGGLFFFVSNREGEAESACSTESSNALYKKAIPLFSYERGITPKDSAALHEIAQSIQRVDGYQKYINCVFVVTLHALEENDLGFAEELSSLLKDMEKDGQSLDGAMNIGLAPADIQTIVRDRKEQQEINQENAQNMGGVSWEDLER